MLWSVDKIHIWKTHFTGDDAFHIPEGDALQRKQLDIYRINAFVQDPWRSVGHRCHSSAHFSSPQSWENRIKTELYSSLPFQFFHRAFWRILVGFQRCACWKAKAEHQYQQNFFHLKNTHTDPALSVNSMEKYITSWFCSIEDIPAFDSACVLDLGW